MILFTMITCRVSLGACLKSMAFLSAVCACFGMFAGVFAMPIPLAVEAPPWVGNIYFRFYVEVAYFYLFWDGRC